MSDTELPRVVLTRLFAHSASESLSLRCAKDKSGAQEYFCEIRKFRNGVEVATTSLYAKQTKSMLDGFLRLVPATEKKRAEVSPIVRESSSKSDPLLLWDVLFDGQRVSGTLFRQEAAQKNPVVEAVLSLEGALDSQFYR
jgi:hypothetical protein